MEFIDLLENYIILKNRDKDLYYDIKDNINQYTKFIKEYLLYDVTIKDQFIKLEKIPSNPQSFMGIKEFKNVREYIFFILLLIFLEDKNKEEQFILSNLTEYIVQNYQNEKIDWTKQKNRRSLVSVMNIAIDIGIIEVNDGELYKFTESENNDVLYESTGISRYILRKIDKDLYNIKHYNELLDECEIKHNVYRNLLLNPIVYSKGIFDIEYEYIKKNINTIKNKFEKNLDWDIHLYKNGALAIINNSSRVKDIFPSKKGEAGAVLILNNKIREMINDNKLNVKENDTIVLSKDEFESILINLRKEKGHGFTKTLRDYSDEYYIDTIIEFMKGFSMLDEENENIVIMPLVGKIIGDYPKDYKEKKYE